MKWPLGINQIHPKSLPSAAFCSHWRCWNCEISENHIIQMLTEPGIIGKIGLISHGIGTCLNILMITY